MEWREHARCGHETHSLIMYGRDAQHFLQITPMKTKIVQATRKALSRRRREEEKGVENNPMQYLMISKFNEPCEVLRPPC